MLGFGALCLGPANLALGRLERALGDTTAAAASFAAAADLAARLEMPTVLARIDRATRGR